MREGSTEYAIFICFNSLLFAHHALDRDDRLGSLPIPVSFFFGDRDWMYTEAGDVIVGKNPFKGSHSKVHSIFDSDHHMYFDNPQGLVEAIFKDLENLQELKLVSTSETRT